MPILSFTKLLVIVKRKCLNETNIIYEMACDYGTSRNHRENTVPSLGYSGRPAQRSQQLRNLTILLAKSRSILNAPPQLQELPGAPENALGASESTSLSFRRA